MVFSQALCKEISLGNCEVQISLQHYESVFLNPTLFTNLVPRAVYQRLITAGWKIVRRPEFEVGYILDFQLLGEDTPRN